MPKAGAGLTSDRACVLHLAGTGDFTHDRRLNLGAPLAAQARPPPAPKSAYGLGVGVDAVRGGCSMCLHQRASDCGRACAARGDAAADPVIQRARGARAARQQAARVRVQLMPGLPKFALSLSLLAWRSALISWLASVQNVATLSLESPFYGARKPPSQRGSKLQRVSDLLMLGRATIEESLFLLAWLQRQGFARLGAPPLQRPPCAGMWCMRLQRGSAHAWAACMHDGLPCIFACADVRCCPWRP